MKRIFHLAMIDIKRMVRDKMYFFWTLLFPLFFIFVFGNLYTDNQTDTLAQLLVLNRDKGQWGTYFIDKIKSPGIDLQIVAKEPEQYNRLLIIPGDFSARIEERKGQALTFKKNREANLEAAAQVETRIIQGIARVISELILHPDTKTFFAEREEFKNLVEIKSRFPEGAILKIPSGFNHVIPGTLVQFILMMVLIFGGISVMEDRQQGILCRVLFSSTTIPQLWGGKFLGRLFMGLIQAFILLITGTLFFSMNLGNVLLTLLTVFFFAMSVASLGILIGSVFRKEDLIIGISILLSVFFSGLGGCWWPIEIVPPVFKQAAMIVPSFWAMDGFHQIIFFKKGFLQLIPNYAVLLAYTVLFSLLSFKFFKIKD